MEVEQAIQQLEQNRSDHGCRDGMSLWLGVVVDDLQQIVLCVLEDHEDTLVLQDDLFESYHVSMGELRTKSHLSNGRLRQARVLDQLALLIGLKSGTGQSCIYSIGSSVGYELFDSEFAFLAISAYGFVYSAISTAADEANNVVLLSNADFARISTCRGPPLI